MEMAGSENPDLLRSLLWASVKTSAVGVAVGVETLKQMAEQAVLWGKMSHFPTKSRRKL